MTILEKHDQLLTGLDAAHRAVAPAQTNIFLRNFVDQETIEGLRGPRGVAGDEPANQISIRYKTTAGSAWEPGILVMRPDYEIQTYDLLLLKGRQLAGRENVRH